MKKNSQYRKIRDLISSSDIGEALKQMIVIADSLGIEKSSDTIVLLQSRFKILCEKINKGVIDENRELLARNKIASSALEELKNLEEKDKPEVSDKRVKQFQELTEEDFLKIAKAANIIIKLEEIKEQFYEAEWDTRGQILSKLFKYSNHNTASVSKEVLSFLSSIANITRNGMKSDIAYTIESLIIHYYPYFEREEEGKDYEELAFECIQIGFSIFYDSAIYLNDFKVGSKGLQILKWIYWRAKETTNHSVMKRVIETYEELETTLKRPERDDLELANEVLQIFKNDLNNWGIFPDEIPDHILGIV